MSEDEKKKPTRPIRIMVPVNLFDYLTFLAETTTMGGSENDVALHILTERLESMRRGPDYAYKIVRKPEK